MATFLDTLGILDFFAPLLSAVLVFAVVFALMAKTHILGDSRVVQTLVAAVLGLLVLLVPDVVEIINFMAPWFVLMFVFLVLLLMTYRMFGISEGSIVEYMMNDRAINWALFAVGILIILGAIASVFGQRALEATAGSGDEEGFESNLYDIIFNVKILGLMLVFAIAIFTIAFLGGGGTAGGGGGHGH
ncbi:MAG TPA: hypothetical protein VJH88_01445 [Candidatus Nanoarchaeia archaeon]|nr:hypothetical protein [Candidatus Nanoarchaeia archaeon]